jgi:hypothetical protein
MNKSNLTQTGGFPLKTERLQEMESSILDFQLFRSFGG